MTVPVSVTLPQFRDSVEPMLTAAAEAERLGLAGVYLVDHLVPTDDPHRPVLEAAAVLGAVAAATRSVRVGTAVLRAGLRGPAVSAAVALTAASIAPGRLVLGLGVGDRLSEGEAARYGMERAGLSARLADLVRTIELVRIAAPGVPVFVAGRHRELLAVAAERADGWNAWGLERDVFAPLAERVRASAPAGFSVSWGGALLVGSDEADLAGLAEARGGTAGVVPLTVAALPAFVAGWDGIADELIVAPLAGAASGIARLGAALTGGGGRRE